MGLTKKVIIIGSGSYAQLLRYYFENEEDSVEVIGYAVEKAYHFSDVSDDGLPVFLLENIEKYSNKGVYCIFAIGYLEMNTIREKLFEYIKKIGGFQIIGYKHPTASISPSTKIGIGNIFFEKVVIQPWCSIGDANVFQSSVCIMHDTVVNSYNFFGASSTVNGRVAINNNVFIGSGATLKNRINIDSYVLIGAGSYVNSDLKERSVIVPSRSILLDKDSFELKI